MTFAAFDQVAILDWSAAKGPRLGRDSIWLGVTDAKGTRAENIPTRIAAEARLNALCDAAIGTGQRLLLGVDFAFGYPSGFAAAVTAQSAALGFWDWLTPQVWELPGGGTNYREVAARINALFPGDGPFWGNGEKAETPGLPRRKPPLPLGLKDHRACDLAARDGRIAPKTVWQLAGAGAVGAQVLTGLPVLNRLRRAREGAIAVWPFQSPTSPVVLAEVYPSQLSATVAGWVAQGFTPDEAQVHLLGQTLFKLSSQSELGLLFEPRAPKDVLAEEGWMLGAGAGAVLKAAVS